MFLKNFKKIFIIYLLPSLLIINFILQLFLVYNFGSDTYELNRSRIINSTFFTAIFSSISITILSPIYEELIYRFWLVDLNKYLRLKIVLIFICFINLYSYMAKVKFNPFFDEFNWIKQKLAISLNQSVLLELDYYSYFGFFVLIFLFYCIIFIVFKIRNFDSIKSKIQNYQYLLIFTLFSSYVFTVSHFKVYDLNLPKFLQLFATGIFFAIIRIKYSFRLSIILHILGNSLILFRELLFTEATNNYLGLLQIFVTFIIILCVLFYIFESKTLLKK